MFWIPPSYERKPPLIPFNMVFAMPFNVALASSITDHNELLLGQRTKNLKSSFTASSILPNRVFSELFIWQEGQICVLHLGIQGIVAINSFVLETLSFMIDK